MSLENRAQFFMASKKFKTTEKLTPAGIFFERERKKLRLGPKVKIGVTQQAFKEEKREAKTPLTLGEIAVVNEFGSARKKKDGTPWIPERSFIRWTHDEHKEKMVKMIDHLRHEVMTGRMTTKRALGLVGQEMQRLIKKRIVDIQEPPNAPSTILAKTRAGKTGDNPLINTGQLLSRILWERHGIN